MFKRIGVGIILEKEYYEYGILLGGRVNWILWYTNTSDGLACDLVGRIMVFETSPVLRDYATSTGLKVAEASTVLDLDSVRRWVDGPPSIPADYPTLLNTWNLWDDIRGTLDCSTLNQDTDVEQVYDKLFWANNPPALTPEGECFIPEWSEHELGILRAQLTDGFELFEKSTVLIGDLVAESLEALRPRLIPYLCDALESRRCTGRYPRTSERHHSSH